MRSRHTAAMLQLVGIHETMASTVDDYAAIAAQLANDPAWRQAIRDRVATEKIRLFRDREAVLALENFLDRAVRNGSEDPVTIR